MLHYTPKAKKFARTLRKKMTPAEVRLWQQLRRKHIDNLQFYRQKPIDKYIVDFYCPRKKLIIEIDGGGHYENGKLIKEDIVREHFLQSQELQILRFTNTEIMTSMESILEEIYKIVRT